MSENDTERQKELLKKLHLDKDLNYLCKKFKSMLNPHLCKNQIIIDIDTEKVKPNMIENCENENS